MESEEVLPVPGKSIPVSARSETFVLSAVVYWLRTPSDSAEPVVEPAVYGFAAEFAAESAAEPVVEPVVYGFTEGPVGTFGEAVPAAPA